MPHSTSPDLAANSSTAHTAQECKTAIYELLGIGFGPASLAIAVALHDKIDKSECSKIKLTAGPRVKFLERQDTFRWHAGMMLPGTKMQISFIKDLATLRDPRSRFTFLNYLHEQQRLIHFSNLDTFLPFRVEFEDYLKWAARHFQEIVDYSRNVLRVRPVRLQHKDKYDCLEVVSQDKFSDQVFTDYSPKVVIAIGGQPSIPTVFPEDPRVIHSSKYASNIEKVLPQKHQPYKIAVVGAGQSAAEIFNDLRTRFPQCESYLVMRDSALRPSDDSPFVNEVFNPDRIDSFYQSGPSARAATVQSYKATNYSVVRPKLIEEIYETMYHQRLVQADEHRWAHRILNSRQVTRVNTNTGESRFQLHLQKLDGSSASNGAEEISVDAVIVATGYVRTAHEKMLRECQDISATPNREWTVNRSYEVQLDRNKATDDLQIFLQGCNEKTHGLSDTLLSILAIRGGEIVDSAFPQLNHDSVRASCLINATLSKNQRSPEESLLSDLKSSVSLPEPMIMPSNGEGVKGVPIRTCEDYVNHRSGMMAEPV